MKTKDLGQLLVPFLLLLAIVLLFIEAPINGAFYVSDSPRHALNGAFVLDLIGSLGSGSPVDFAYNYYSQYPALTILFYPPLFSFILAPFYAIFGVSQEVALFVIFLFYFLFAIGTYRLARNWLSQVGSFAVALILVVAPEIALWGRQVMLEIPAFAFLVWSAGCFVAHLKFKQIGQLYLSCALFVLALYTKLSVVFVALPYLIFLLKARGTGVFRDKHSYIILVLTLAGLAPLIYLTLEFGLANITSMAGIKDATVPRFSLDGMLWYAKQLPWQMGWPVILSALLYVCCFPFNKVKTQTSKLGGYFLLSWFIVGYIFYSLIDLKEARHSLFLLLPLAIAAVAVCYQLFPRIPRLADTLALSLGLVTLIFTLNSRPVLYVDGYLQVAQKIAAIAPKNHPVLFSGYRDGAFIFNLRTLEERRDLSVVRADKLLLKIAVRRSLGVEEKQFSEVEIGDMLNRLGIHYIVAQPDFWTDLLPMARLQRVLNGPQFQQVERFSLNSNYNARDQELIIYKNLGEVSDVPEKIAIELPIINRVLPAVH